MMAGVQENYAVPKEGENVFSIMRYPSGNVNGTESIENLIQVNSRAAIFKKKHFYKKVSSVLVVLLILLLIGLIVLAILYVKLRNEDSSICTSDECLRVAANFKYSMDMTVDPCEDFYEYSCGHWSEEHPNHGWYPKFSTFETIGERVGIHVVNFLKTNASEEEPVPVQQTRDFYQSCMDQVSTDKLGYSVIYNYLKQVNLPTVPSFFNKSLSENFTFDWLQTEVLIKRTFSMDVFLQLSIDASIFDRNLNVIYMGAPSAGSPLPTPLKLKKKTTEISTLDGVGDGDDDVDEELREELYSTAYKKIIKEVIKVVVANHTKLDEALLDEGVNHIWNISSEIYELLNDTETDDLDIIKVRVKDIQNTTDTFLASNAEKPQDIWEKFVLMMFDEVPNVTLALNDTDMIYIRPFELNYLGEILLYLKKTPFAIIELYMWWVTVHAMIMNTTSDIIQFIYKQSTPFVSDPVYKPRSLGCAELVTEFMGIAVSYGIADKMFMNNTKPKVEQMLNDIKTAFVKRVNGISWMDVETKKATLEKSKEMLSFIGFPEWLMDKDSVELYYGNISMESNTYLENLMTIVKLFMPSRLAALRVPNDRNWRTDPVVVNAFHYFSDNAINVPMAILTFPMYHLGLESLNYGSLGSILGHELTHGFDNTGRKFDKYGNYRQWWTNKTIETFENNAECFVKQYDNYTIPNVDENIKGKDTLGENLADNGGLHHAYSAYMNYVKNNKPEPHLPGFENFTSTQLFFLAFGSIWCESRSPSSYKEQIISDEHCPNKIRVIGTLQNSEEFSKAFKCRKGSYMNPKRGRCRIW